MSSLSDLIIVVAGVGLIVVAVIWRRMSRNKVRQQILEGLASPDPETRKHTIEIVSEHGLAGHTAMFNAMTQTEQDPRVLDALATAVVRNQWEPADNPDVIELRLWAAGRRAAPSSSAPISQQSPPPPPVPAPAPEPEIETEIEPDIEPDDSAAEIVLPEAVVLDDVVPPVATPVVPPAAPPAPQSAPTTEAKRPLPPPPPRPVPKVVDDEPIVAEPPAAAPERPIEIPEPVVLDELELPPATAIVPDDGPQPALPGMDTDPELDQLAPKVHDVLGDVEGIEFVDLEGHVLRSWGEVPRDAREADRPSS